jgi:hypothetical protein
MIVFSDSSLRYLKKIFCLFGFGNKLDNVIPKTNDRSRVLTLKTFVSKIVRPTNNIEKRDARV